MIAGGTRGGAVTRERRARRGQLAKRSQWNAWSSRRGSALLPPRRKGHWLALDKGLRREAKRSGDCESRSRHRREKSPQSGGFWIGRSTFRTHRKSSQSKRVVFPRERDQFDGSCLAIWPLPSKCFTGAVPKNERAFNVGTNNPVMRKLMIALVVLSSLLPSFAVASVRRRPPPFPRLRLAWSHAEINVVIGRKPHTLILDRGRVTHISPTRLTLYEVDRTVVTVTLRQQALVQIDGAPGIIDAVKTGMYARTMRIDGGAAVRISAKRPHPPKASGGSR